jgi:hypothetical protein
MKTMDLRRPPCGTDGLKLPAKIARTGNLWAFMFILLLVATMTTGFTQKAAASTIQTAVVACPSCASAGDLLAFATSYFGQYGGTTPPGYTGTINLSPTSACGNSSATNGTNLLVISALVPISEFFYECLQKSGNTISTTTFTVVVKPLDTGANADTISNDGLLLDRSAKVGTVTLPPGYSVTGTTQEIISAYLSSADGVPQSGASTLSPWHALTNYPQLVQGQFTNIQTGETFTLWNGDTITVTDSNGNTAKFMWTPLSSVQWALVPNSLRDKNGNPIGGTPKTAVPAGGSVTVTLPNGQTTVVTPYQAPDGDPPLPKGTVTVEPEAGIVIVGCYNGGACSDIPNL